jgi:hypothetical protein
MTAVWGPLGWMTLHSASTSYPEAPTLAEKQLVSSWIEMFRDTITCPHCRDHFAEIHANYKRVYPNYLDSRQNFAMFVFRAHNTVNRRLKKPIYETVAACMERLKENIKSRPARDYRVAYINHIQKFWRTFQDVTGIVALKKINEMRRIEGEYFFFKDTHFNVQLQEEVVTVPRGVLEKDAPELVSPTGVPIVFRPAGDNRVASRMPMGGGFRMTANGLRLR